MELSIVKKILSWTMICALLVGLIPMMGISVYADEVTYAVTGGKIRFDPDSGMITGSDKSVTTAAIPSTINGVSVTGIGENAFYRCVGLGKITIPSSVISIGKNAFGECNSLTEITVDNDNTAYCSIDGVLFNKTATELLRYPSEKSINSYSVPESVQSIRYRAFEGCSILENLEIPKSVTNIESWIFYNCNSLKQINVDFDNSEYCSINGVLFNKSRTELLYYPSKKSGTSYSIPNNVTNIGEWAFSYCNELTSVTIPDSVASIGDYAFYYCENLASMTIPNGMINIGENAFAWCINLVSVTIPNSVTNIGISAFSYCDRLTDIYYAGDESEWNAISISSYNAPLSSATIHYNSTGSNDPKPVYEGWHKDNIGWWYQNADGTYPKNTWKKNDGKWYHFDKKGYMQTGWLQDNGEWYYLQSDGAMVTGWLQVVNSDWYYFNESGAMLHDTWKGDYYLTSSGKMATDTWIGNYYVDSSGKWDPTKVKGGTWKKDNIGWWYQNEDDTYPKNMWQKIDGKWYHFNDKGYMQTGWLKDNDEWYYLKSDGSMATGWLEIGSDYYYFNANGAMAHDTWKGDYYLTSSGKMAVSTWIGDYYVGENGKWVRDAGKKPVPVIRVTQQTTQVTYTGKDGIERTGYSVTYYNDESAKPQEMIVTREALQGWYTYKSVAEGVYQLSPYATGSDKTMIGAGTITGTDNGNITVGGGQVYVVSSDVAVRDLREDGTASAVEDLVENMHVDFAYTIDDETSVRRIKQIYIS